MFLQQNLDGVCLHQGEPPLPEPHSNSQYKNHITICVESNLINNNDCKKKGCPTVTVSGHSHEMVSTYRYHRIHFKNQAELQEKRLSNSNSIWTFT